MPDDDLPMLVLGVSFVIENERQWVFKDSYRLIKTYAVFACICACFLWIPLELHDLNYSEISQFAKFLVSQEF